MIKKNNAGQFLYKNSAHPPHIFKNVPKSLFIRLKRICSNFYDYLFNSRILFLQLIKRGYEPNFIFKIMKIVNKIDRLDLIKYKVKNSNKNENNIRLFINFDLNFLNLRSIVLYNFEILKNSFTWLNNVKLTFNNSVSQNLKNILIDNSIYNTNYNYKTSKCDKINCKICNFVFKYNFITLKNNLLIPMKDNANCDSCGIIYIIICVKCKSYYIGESSKSARTRLLQHIYNIKKFKPFLKIFSEVADHFNLKGHNFEKDFKFSIFKKNIKEKTLRLDIETDLSHIFELSDVIMNIKKPKHTYINNLCFI